MDLLSAYQTIEEFSDIIWKHSKSTLTFPAGTLDSLLVDFDHVFIAYGPWWKKKEEFFYIEEAVEYSFKIKQIIRKKLGIPDNVEIAHL